jgi:hypothetical protein
VWVGIAINMKTAFNTVNYTLDQATFVFTPREYIHVSFLVSFCIYLQMFANFNITKTSVSIFPLCLTKRYVLSMKFDGILSHNIVCPHCKVVAPKDPASFIQSINS